MMSLELSSYNPSAYVEISIERQYPLTSQKERRVPPDEAA